MAEDLELPVFNHPLALELTYIAVEEAIRLGASYADARFEFRHQEDVVTHNGRLDLARTQITRGLGVRVLLHGAWGYVGVSEPSRHDVTVAARRAAELARAAAILQSTPVELVPQTPHRAIYRTQIKRDPLAVPLENKVALLLEIDDKLTSVGQIVSARGHFSAQRQRKLFVSSDGSEIEQELVYTAVGYQAGASDGDGYQVRSYPIGGGGLVMGKGWELVNESPLLESAEEVAEEAVALLSAPVAPADTGPLILSAPMIASHLQATCAPLTELDRTLSADGFIPTDQLGAYVFGSDTVNLYADAREAGGAGGFGFDDEGVEAQRVDLVVDGRLVGFLTSRETAQRVGLESSSGAMRASGWEMSPQVRCTNLCLAPGEGGDLDALINDTERGILIDGPKAILLDPGGGGFVGQGEVAWKIENGKKVQRLRDPVYRGLHPTFWRGCDAVCSPDSFQMFGSFATKSGGDRPLPVGHGAAPARFADVEVGAKAEDLPRIDSTTRIPTIDVPDGPGLTARREQARAFRKPPAVLRTGPRRRVRRKDVR